MLVIASCYTLCALQCQHCITTSCLVILCCFHRALRVMRISLLAGELQAMRLSSSGALLSGAASSRLFQLITSVLTLLFTTSSIVSCLHPLLRHL